MKKLKLFTLALLSAFSLLAIKPVLAQYTQEEEVNQIVVDKTIKGLDQSEWKDNYSSSDMIFKPGDQFEFRIIVKNTGNRNLTWIDVKDSLPSSLDYIFGRGDYNAHVVSWQIPEIKPGEDQVTIIRVKVNSAIPVELKEWFNQVDATAESGASDSDISAFWTAEGTSQNLLPVTGPVNQIVVGTLISLSLLGVVAISRKYARGY
ncbi:DUF11 domain-containing protein [Patescibacteria group bacterium]|nr:DUF11 domain-containing protein [Patescibacteria group bacterium]MCG2701646.1 DUF11 domain-containing protein [Candidatus Parcubacteria bacterium]MBU4264994.1 DUF11 domain-containing protein [Patescibacteria group bacterium]MBU4390147.1 DUF11 domain-containing protein [Patescibacteria group bacterium]MBU4397080.1 DUF11 domain-containing protein [Patescibacteria group bacterium]